MYKLLTALFLMVALNATAQRIYNSAYFTRAATFAGYTLYKDTCFNMSNATDTLTMKLRNDSVIFSHTLSNLAGSAGSKFTTVKTYINHDIALSGLFTNDSVSINDGDRVLVNGQTDRQQNGIYIAHSGAWIRATDSDEPSEIIGQLVAITGGGYSYNPFWFNGLYQSACVNAEHPWGATFELDTVGYDNISYFPVNDPTAVIISGGSGINVSGYDISADTTIISTRDYAENLVPRRMIMKVRQDGTDPLFRTAEIFNNTGYTIIDSTYTGVGEYRLVFDADILTDYPNLVVTVCNTTQYSATQGQWVHLSYDQANSITSLLLFKIIDLGGSFIDDTQIEWTVIIELH